MKKLITLCLFIFALLSGTQTADAQESKTKLSKEEVTSISNYAVKQTKTLQKTIGFEEYKSDKIFELIREHRYNLLKLDNLSQKEGYKEKLATFNKQLDSGMQSVLSVKEYKLYKNN